MILKTRRVQEAPNGKRVVVDAFRTFLFRVAKERAEEIGVGVLDQLDEVRVREFEGAGELVEELVDAVQPLQEDRTAFVLVVATGRVAAAVGEFVAEGQPFAFY